MSSLRILNPRLYEFVPFGFIQWYSENVESLGFQATPENVSRSFGTATSTTIVETIQMNRLINAETKIAQLDGRNVPRLPTTDAFLHGCSVTAKTTAGELITIDHIDQSLYSPPPSS